MTELCTDFVICNCTVTVLSIPRRSQDTTQISQKIILVPVYKVSNVFFFFSLCNFLWMVLREENETLKTRFFD